MTGRILHVTGDHPDLIDPSKTPVIESLLSLTSDRFEHRVLSINRKSPGLAFAGRVLAQPWSPELRTRIRTDRPELTTVVYEAPPRGIYHLTMLMRLADALLDEVGRGPRPDLVVGHKLTIEGPVVQRMAQRLGIPYAVSIQGNTDMKIIRVRSDLRSVFASVFVNAAVVFPFAPWALAAVEARLGRRGGPTLLLPCPTPSDEIIAPQLVGPNVVSVFHLRKYRLKNAARLVRAAAVVEHSVPGLTLDIVGEGSDEDRAGIEGLIKKAGAQGVRLAGPIPHRDIQQRLNRAGGFAMVSLNESFGLVFIESLLAGCPIVYPRGISVEGYFDGMPFAIAAEARDQHSINDAVMRLVKDEVRLKASLSDWLRSDEPERFRREAIARQFGDGLELALAAT